MDDNMKEIVLRDRETRLNISRVPKKTREEFIQFAEEDFEGDYGMLLREIWEKYKEYSFYQNLDIKLNHIIQLLENRSEKKSNEEEGKSIKMLSGKVLKGKGDEK